MSKDNNVNPNFYKDGGREHTEGPDKAEVRQDDKEAMARQKSRGSEKRQGKEGQPNFIPGEPRVGESGEGR